ncbi:CIA30 family protein [Sediminibacterium sp.]|uniref:CIA30 family protein n=1 Tax=Sediminibacterium sp. TaxID=1917865 RepID=UPI0027360832|nr:CIA30 family protein [Sediminibacterium sp.]MDP3394387.1 CIA30 family protein [Sediminibacterium sp.]MDP3568222.1 CIA30 family protein [Sediminibacterium sp.]
MINWILLLLTLNLYPKNNRTEIYHFSSQSNLREWRIVNDGVMGGISKSNLVITSEGYGQYSGHVSLANNGGFASIQLNQSASIPTETKYIVLRVKGDGKQYEFRIKNDLYQLVSYVHPFKTSGEWQNIQLAISDFYPQYFGQKLNRSNFNYKNIEQISFLISNKQEEDFKILIDNIIMN